ncbi:hypothetical protein GTQ34_16505 [Muricauda sp. JGD-17]|uniref:Uncharacterized protein n=1 Tax=Flagellimonas ochracea TaxID=2696472 RepID=A0A964TEK4_9FLAO|nr:hypothetical protein [Allomuricauda ochracea]NAY93510.1 hypothetical protein [Allomuricauda ochracea]
MTELLLTKYRIQTTGADGGHNYILTEVLHKGVNRKIVIIFIDKSEEINLDEIKPIKVKGEIEDSGIEHDLIMTNAKVIQ